MAGLGVEWGRNLGQARTIELSHLYPDHDQLQSLVLCSLFLHL